MLKLAKETDGQSKVMNLQKGGVSKVTVEKQNWRFQSVLPISQKFSNEIVGSIKRYDTFKKVVCPR